MFVGPPRHLNYVNRQVKNAFIPLECKITNLPAVEKSQNPKNWTPEIDGANIPADAQPIHDTDYKINNIDIDPATKISKPYHEPGLLLVPPDVQNRRSEEFENRAEWRSFLRTESRLADQSRFELEDSKRIVTELGEDRLNFGREARPEGAETNRLVNTRECPTNDKTLNQRGSVARIYSREWSGETRVSIESFLRDPEAPPPTCGERWTEVLTEAGCRAIIDSGAYVSVMRGGYTTFLTLTLDKEARERVNTVKPFTLNGAKGDEVGEIKASGKFSHIGLEGDFCSGTQASGLFVPIEFTTESTIGRETSRFFDGMQKMYQRGAKLSDTGDMFADLPPSPYVDVKHSEFGPVPIQEKLDYMWVAENPMKQTVVHTEFGPGFEMANNPHVHVLMRWRVPHKLFYGWAARIEKIWGQGFAHLEKIHTPEAGAGYLLKAANYLTKSSHVVDPTTGEVYPSQGVIRGNRYNISRSARAPKFECIAEFEAREMARIVYETGIDLQWHHQRLKDGIEQQRAGMRSDKAEIAIVKNLNLPEKTKKRKIEWAEKRIKAAEAQIKGMSETRRTSPYGNKFRITVKSDKQFNSFLRKAIVSRGWSATSVNTEYRNGGEIKSMGWEDVPLYLREKIDYQRRDKALYDLNVEHLPVAPQLPGVQPAPDLGISKELLKCA